MTNVTDDVQLHYVETFDEAEAFMRWLGERRTILGCDTETSGFSWWRDELRLVQFGDLRTGWAIPFGRGGWGALVKDALARYEDPMVFHNLKFDMKFLEQNGCAVKRANCHDTRSMAHLLDPSQLTGLKPLGVRHVDARSDAGQTALKTGMTQNKWNWATVPTDYPPYWIYSALDPVLTAHLYQKFKPQMIGQLADMYELEVANIMILDDIERRGARVDVPYCIAAQAEQLAWIEHATKWVADNYKVDTHRGEIGLSPGSHKRIAAQLQADGVVLTVRTPEGNWAMNEKVLSKIDHPLAVTVLGIRKATKLANTYFGNYIEYADGDILHPDINPLGAVTGRMSVSHPALQQIPRTKYLRDPFLAREGNRLLSVDFDQIEYRLMAHLSEDPGLIGAFGSGDFFTNLARLAYNDESIQKGDPLRQRMKSAAYAKAYGSGVKKFSETAGITFNEAEQFFFMFDSTFPGVKRYQQKMDHDARAKANSEGLAYVTTAAGRRQSVSNLNYTYKLTNYMIQGSAADIFKDMLVDLDQAGLTDYMVLPVHDEAVFDAPADVVEDLAVEVKRIFEKDRGLLVPLTAGSDIVDRWGDKYGKTDPEFEEEDD